MKIRSCLSRIIPKRKVMKRFEILEDFAKQMNLIPYAPDLSRPENERKYQEFVEERIRLDTPEWQQAELKLRADKEATDLIWSDINGRN